MKLKNVKILLTILLVFTLSLSANATVPELMSYQVVVRDAANKLLSGTAVTMEISILTGSDAGAAVYVEHHAVTTNLNGLASVMIGNGTGKTGTLAGVDWSTGAYWIKTGIDPAAGTNYAAVVSNTQLLTTPYAMHAKTAANTSGNATTATTATNILGGLVGQIPYQSAANTTALLAAGTAGQLLQSNGGAAPSWTSATTASTSLTTPLIIGGTAVGSKITYKSTTGTGTTISIAHQFIGGTDGATTIATMLNSGNVGLGNAGAASVGLNATKDITGGTTAYQILAGGTVKSDATAGAVGFTTSLSTDAAAFTTGHLVHYQAAQGTIGAGSVVSNQSGFVVDAGLTGATNNFGFRGKLAAGTGRYNIYMDGTALNYFGGKVGIGTTAPNSTLQVNGDIRIAGPATTNAFASGVIDYLSGYMRLFSFPAADNATGGFRFVSKVSTAGVWSDTYPMNILPSGNVGIGTTTPTGRLTIDTSLGANHTTAATARQILIGEGSHNDLYKLALGYYLEGGTSWNGVIQAKANNVGCNLLLNPLGGNVGIGTTAPATNLEVSATDTAPVSASSLWDSSGGQLDITSTAANAAEGGSALTFRSLLASGAAGGFAAIKGGIETTGGNMGFLSFLTRTTTAYATERMRITSAGNVGIGITTPLSQMHLSGDIATNGAAQFYFDGYNSGGVATSAPAFISRIARGTVDSPLRTQSGDVLFANGVRGSLAADNITTSTFMTTGATRIVSVATGNFVDGSCPARIDFECMPSNSSTVRTTTMSVDATQVTMNSKVIIATSQTPASATATGTTGQVVWDANYIYVCVATNTWKRTAIATW